MHVHMLMLIYLYMCSLYIRTFSTCVSKSTELKLSVLRQWFFIVVEFHVILVFSSLLLHSSLSLLLMVLLDCKRSSDLIPEGGECSSHHERLPLIFGECSACYQCGPSMEQTPEKQ